MVPLGPISLKKKGNKCSSRLRRLGTRAHEGLNPDKCGSVS